ncbi:MAG: VOC family protein [Paracoccaceae bacterium]
MTEQARPLRMGRVALTVNDLNAVSDYYQKAIGLHLLRSDGESHDLGVQGDTLLQLRADKAARRASPREAGLFHTAFLLPDRAALGRWIDHAIKDRIAVTGASDHLVSEAVYLTDPEGNGIEIYADRPRDQWKWKDGQVEMATYQLDVEPILKSAAGLPWTGFPQGSVVGHVHLQAGALPAAEGFYHRLLGMDITTHYPGATFYSAEGYHHHIATNIWNSRGAGPREFPSTGLAELEVRAPKAFVAAAEERLDKPVAHNDRGLVLTDPWGTEVVLMEA